MDHKFVRFVKSRPAVLLAAVVFLLAAAAGIAAILGVFGGGDTKDTVAADGTVTAPYSSLKLSGETVKITALDSDSLGVSPASAFKLAFDGEPDEKEVASALRVEPEQSYQLKKESRGEFRVQFDKPLENNRIYRFILSDKNTGEEQSWAFQTKNSLNVVRSLPRNKSTQVPVNSGIEITFTSDKIESPENYFEISPKTAGRFEQHGKTLVFVPDGLTEATVYTVTIKKGLGVKGSEEVLGSDYSFRFQTVVPEASASGKSYFAFSEGMSSFTPQAAPAIEVYTEEKLVNTEVQAELFSYPDADSFLKDLKNLDTTPPWAISRNKAEAYDVSKLQKAASVKARILSYQREYWSTTYLLLPSALPEGYYLLKTEVEGVTRYTRLQVNPASVYLLATRDKTLAWLNDSVSGNPLSGAEVLFDGESGVRSDPNGLAVLSAKLPEVEFYQNYYYMIRPAEGNPFVAQMKSTSFEPYYNYAYNSDIMDHYWTYLYLDKGMYLPEDTVHAWGIVRPRDGGSMEKEALLELVRYDYSQNGDENVSVLASQRVTLSSSGTFTGSLRLSGYNPGSYQVRVKIGDKVLLNNYLQIMEYTKPAYRLDIESDRNYLYAWEPIRFDIRASFFEGTPVKGLKLNYSLNAGGSFSNGTPSTGSLVSNEAGASSLKVTPMTNEESWHPQYLSLYVNNEEAEEQAVSEQCTVPVFPKDTMIEAEASIDGANGKIALSTSRIDLSRLKGTAPYYTEDEYRGAAVNMPLKVVLYEKYYEQVKTGDYYDYINKVRRDTYEYRDAQRLVREYGVTTVNGKYEIQFTAEKDKNYYAEITGTDSQGRFIKETRYIYNWNFYNPYAGHSLYSIAGKNDNHAYRPGETVSVEVKKEQNAGMAGTETESGKTAKYLFIRMKSGILDTRVSADPKYDFPFANEHIPNMFVKALCFDGTNIYDAGIQQYNYDSAGSKLSVSVQADKEQYKPGETVKLAFDVKDAAGKPCSSEVNVSVVDEAFFALSPQYVDLLSSLYSPSVSSGILSDYLSYHSFDESGSPMAEMGEGGDVYVRKDFKDSALFVSVTSDGNGRAEASFKLPDNLTSWRVTYQAVTGDLKAGSGTMNITSQLPFFVDTIFNNTFMAGDSPSLLIRANGTELPAAAKVDYTVVLTAGDGTAKSFKASGTADQLAEVQLDALPAGKYAVKVEAVCGNLKDAMERSFKVADSLLETSKTDYTDLADGTALKNDARGLTTLVFYGEDSSLLYNELQSLYWSWGQRLDQKLAVKIAGEMLQKNFNEELYREEDFDIKNYQTEDGGLALLTYDSSNPALSAKLCSLAADYIDRESLASYFRKLLDSSSTMPEDVAYAYWGLAALHEPVLLEIQSRLEAADLTPQIKLILGVALSEIGDYQGARDIYNEIVKSKGKTEATYAYIDNGTRDESIDATALCSLIGLRINAPDKLKYFNYIRSNSTSELLVNLERLIFVKNYIKEASLDCGFQYELDGSKKQVDLKNGGYYRMTVTPEKLASLKFSNVRGKVVAASTYVAPVKEVLFSADSPVSISRVYLVGGVQGSVSDFDRSDTVRIKLTPEFGEAAPDGYYEITDILPAGFRYISGNPVTGQSKWYPDEVSGQKVVFGYYYSKKSFRHESIEYYAKAVSPGTYTADNAAIHHVEGSLTSFAEKMKVRVK